MTGLNCSVGLSSETGTFPQERGSRDVLALLPPGTMQHVYSGPEEMQAILYEGAGCLEGDFIATFTQVSPADFETLDERAGGKKDYLSDIQTLIIVMPSAEHESARHEFEKLLTEKAMGMAVGWSIRYLGSTLVRARNRSKESDVSYAPKERGDAARLPTIAVEVGWSETQAKLIADSTWWFNYRGSRVNRVITIDIKRGSGNIIFTAWERRRWPTVQYPDPEPVAVEKVTIKRPEGSNCPRIEGNQITIPFEQLLLRQPGEGERDFIFSKEDLLQVAEAAWF